MHCFMENTDSPAEFIALIARRMLRLVSIVIQCTAYIPLVRVYGRETVCVVELLSDIDACGNYSTKPEKYGTCCKKFSELTRVRVTFQTGQKYGSLSKDLCHPKAIVWCSAKIPAGQSHWKFLQISLSSSHQDTAI